MLEISRQQFSTKDYEFFCRVKLRREPPEVAADLGSPSLVSVYKKVSRVYTWLQEEGQGLLDASAF